eukprot:CAMPEP_0172308126 /NCGR_PEP_ID=MMETSP1058-20130122/8834_1 /TAXON_ID=83371 /ORGANISM="Detonula confervacea, Strain CCMP 353" /LENGTH=55 /DNA_ID=CAMNT_0013020483 /DNA_START=186 /DNA_END=350 /DNA_ORIENTATION=-
MTVEESLMLSNDEQPRNAPFPIILSPSLNTTSTNSWQPLNVPRPTSMTVEGSLML